MHVMVCHPTPPSNLGALPPSYPPTHRALVPRDRAGKYRVEDKLVAERELDGQLLHCQQVLGMEGHVGYIRPSGTEC